MVQVPLEGSLPLSKLINLTLWTLDVFLGVTIEWPQQFLTVGSCMVGPLKMTVLLLSIRPLLELIHLPTYLPLPRLVTVLIFRSEHLHLDSSSKGCAPLMFSLVTVSQPEVKINSPVTGNILPHGGESLQDLASDR